MRWIIALFAFVLVALQLELWFADDMRRELIQVREFVAEQSAINQSLIERNADTVAEIINLKESNEAAEERARSELGLALPGESFYQIAEIKGQVNAE